MFVYFIFLFLYMIFFLLLYFQTIQKNKSKQNTNPYII